MEDGKRQKEIEAFFEESENQAGINELAHFYNCSKKLLEFSNRYLEVTKPKIIVSVTNNTGNEEHKKICRSTKKECVMSFNTGHKDIC